jgi:predicted dehydrogenase
VEIVAICSPHAAHLPQLETAAAAGCHVFCEKPLWWCDDLEAAHIEPAVDRVLEALQPGKTLALNTQWPHTLGGFRQLYPGVAEAPLESLTMWLSPNNPSPRQMIVDSGSHLLSMLQALAGTGTIDDPRCELKDETLSVRCAYDHPKGRAQVELRLKPCAEVPRPAGYAVNGRAVERLIELPAYHFTFEADDGRRVPLEDPLAGCVRAFVESAKSGRSPNRARILAGMTQLFQLAAVSTQEVVWPRN